MIPHGFKSGDMAFFSISFFFTFPLSVLIHSFTYMYVPLLWNSYFFGIVKDRIEYLGQRHINITRNAIDPKSGQKDCRKF